VKLSSILFKPKWQDKDAATRLAAVATDADPGLIAALPELTRSDPDARVRIAALKRLGDYERWRERSTGDADTEVRRTARSAYITMLCAGASNCPPLPRLIAELDTLSPVELETVATAAVNRDLRAAALGLVTRPALFAERAGADPDPALRALALQRVSDPAALERIAERARKSDKIISRLARERLESLRIGSGDVGAIAARARVLCERIETLLRNPGSDPDAARVAIELDWNNLGAGVPVALTARFRGAAALITQLAARRGNSVPSEPALAAPAEAASAPALSTLPSAERNEAPGSAAEIGDAVVSRARFDAALAAAAGQSRREREQSDMAAARAIEQMLSRYEAALDAGDTHAAQAAHAKLAPRVKAAGKISSAIERRLAPLDARFAELKRWQHWSNQRRRRTLCEEIEALVAAGLHPDAVATRVHDARTEWHRLDAMEGGEKSAAAPGLVRRFQSVCQHALKPAQAYFEKRDSVRDAHRNELEALLARVAAVPAETADWKALSALQRQLSGALRSLDGLSPRDRNHSAKRIKDAIALISPRIEEHAQGIQKAKARLIEQAQALSLQADRGAARAARELQQQWTAVGEGLRAIDQKQWREFRTACDRVFAALDAGRKEREASVAAQVGQVQAIVDEAEALANDADADTDTVAARRRDLDARWRAVATNDHHLDQRWRKALERLTVRSTERAREKRLARYSLALRKYALLRELEHGAQPAELLAPRWDAHAALIAEFAAPLEDRWTRACGESTPADAAEDDAARGLLVRLEFTAGIASPAEDRQRRMDYQVARLSARMRGGATMTPERELDEIFAAWFAQSPQPLDLEQRFERAATSAIDALP
jgi:exonuclease SbcC